MKEIPCYFWGIEVTKRDLTLKEILEIKKEYRKAALTIMKKLKADHVVYYRDERDSNDNIIMTHFYTNVEAMDDEKFHSAIRDYIYGIIEAVHAKK